jgi:hypothetical protein
VLLEHNPVEFEPKNWRRRPDLNRGWRFCRFNGVVNRVVSCWFLVCPAPPFCLVLGPYWTTFGLRLPVSHCMRRPSEGACHSSRNATIGSTLAAQRAGRHAAVNAAMVRHNTATDTVGTSAAADS